MSRRSSTYTASGSPSPAPTANNRLGLDYAAEAAGFAAPPAPIVDVHSHVNGGRAAAIYRRAAELYGVGLTYSMTRLEEAQAVRDVLGDRIRFIASPNYQAEDDRRYHMGAGYVPRIERFHEIGARVAKFWAAPRAIDYATEMGDPTFLRLDAPHRIAAMETAAGLGMAFMTHVADPDTWFRAKYADAATYGNKLDQYEPFERLLDRFTQPWIAAHMGGWPEDLAFLTGLLDRHDNLYLDTSATKWMVRELSRHSRADLVAFLERFRGRILFGSDIVTTDEHLATTDDENEFVTRAASPEDAFDLYAGRYWALRTMYETDYDGASPIADPDLAMVEPDRYTEMDAPRLVGRSLPRDLLKSIYHDAAQALLEPLYRS